jgi:hypothetical protein
MTDIYEEEPALQAGDLPKKLSSLIIDQTVELSPSMLSPSAQSIAMLKSKQGDQQLSSSPSQ